MSCNLIPQEALVRAGFREDELDGTWQPFGPVGCDLCKNTGYKGRVGLFELMIMNNDLRDKIMNNAQTDELRNLAQKQGMVPLRQAGINADADLRNEKISYKVREHSLAKVPILMAVGAREVDEHTVAVRRLGSKQQQVVKLSDAISQLSDEIRLRGRAA